MGRKPGLKTKSRSTRTGKYVSAADAAVNKDTTVTETESEVLWEGWAVLCPPYKPVLTAIRDAALPFGSPVEVKLVRK